MKGHLFLKTQQEQNDRETHLFGVVIMSKCTMEAERVPAENSVHSDDETTAHIRMRNIKKTFGSGQIVACDNVSLDIDSMDFVVLLGPSGCGKTTTLRCLAGLEQPDSGTIHIGDEEVTNKKPKDRDLAFVFQSIALFPHMTVRKNISFGLDMISDFSTDEKDQRVEQVAGLLGIEEMLDRKPAELSGGQQQRVSLGRAMVMEPEAFLLDEPFSALDANLRDQMRVEVKQLQRELETAMVFVTHDQEEAMTLGDKIVVMDDATIQQIGSPYEIYNEPVNEFVSQFIGSPSANFIRCDVIQSEKGLAIESDLFQVVLSDEQVSRYEGESGQSATLGIRPEYLNLDLDLAGTSLFEADVSVVEPHGARDAVHLVAEDTSLTAVTPQGKIDRDTQTVAVDFEMDNIWLFDDSGERLL